MNRSGSAVALINPPHVARLNREFESGVPPLGLGSIAAHLRANGVCCDIYDLADDWPLERDALLRIGLFEYDIFGLTSYSKNFFAAEKLLRIIREERPQASIVLGGPHAGAIPEHVLRSVPDVDFVVRNEGEAAMLRLVQELRSASPRFDQVPNLVYRMSTEIVSSVVEDLGGVALDDYAWPSREARARPPSAAPYLRRDGQIVRKEFLSSSRGCPKRCTFCSIIVMSPQYRYRSASSLMHEISELHRRESFGHIVFLDANFFVNWRRAREFAERLHDFDPTMTWSGTATTDQICRHWDTVLHIGSLNCSSMEIGIENGSNSVLSRFNKQTTVEQNAACIEILRAAGIKLDLDFILFDPFISIDELADNMTFLEEVGLSDYAPADHLYSAVKLYPGTAARAAYLKRCKLDADDFGIPPFENARVQAVFDAQIWFARTHLLAIEKAVEKLDKAFDFGMSRTPGCALDPLRISELLIALRRAPFLFFAELVRRSLLSETWSTTDSSLRDIVFDLNINDLLSQAEGNGVGCATPVVIKKQPDYGRVRIIETSSGSYLLSEISRPLALSQAGVDVVRRALDGNAEREQQRYGAGEITLSRAALHQLFTDLGVHVAAAVA